LLVIFLFSTAELHFSHDAAAANADDDDDDNDDDDDVINSLFAGYIKTSVSC